MAEKVGVIETAAEFFKKRAGDATGSGLMKFLRATPKFAPEPEDKLVTAIGHTSQSIYKANRRSLVVLLGVQQSVKLSVVYSGKTQHLL